MSVEIWKDIRGYEGLYQISNLGRVKALAKEWLAHHTVKIKHEEVMLKQYVNDSGYLRVALYKDNKCKKFPVHRLVAEAFIGLKPSKAHIVNHKDFNKLNNCVDNLEWLTQKENARYSRANIAKSRLEKVKSNTGEHYIYFVKNKYRVSIEIYGKYITNRGFNTLNEAIKYRDTILGGIKNGKEKNV